MTRVWKITIPKSVTEIGRGAFYYCSSLSEVVFEEGSTLRTIEREAFYCCRYLTKVNLPEGLKSIEYSAFSYCERLKNIRLPDGLEKIGVECFRYSGLEKIVLPASVREVSSRAFSQCERLKSVCLNDGLEKLGAEETIDGKQYGGGVFAKSAIESVRLPPTLKRLERITFHDCKNLKSIEIPHGVEYIGQACLY